MGKKNRSGKRNYGKAVPRCEDCENLIACGEGDHICMEGDKAPIMGYEPTDEYLWCGGAKYKKQ